MKNTEAAVGVLLTQSDKIKKNILDRTLKKIEDMQEKANEVDEMNEEFYIFIRKTRYPKTMAEQERTTKKINLFQTSIRKKLDKISERREEIDEIIDTLYELSKIEDENSDAKERGQIFWADIRREIQKKIKKPKIK